MLGGGLVDILLGPEGTRVKRVFSVLHGHGPPVMGWWNREILSSLTCGGGRCVLFENWTVDASIFNESKCIRAHGGCLGTRSR